METELKLALTRDLVRPVRALLARWGTGQRQSLDSVYYDTTDCLLLRHRMALRVRADGAGWIQTLKTAGGGTALARRGEWETPAPRGKLLPARFADTPLAPLLKQHPRARLRPLFATTFERTTWQVRFAGASIEAALDRGHIHLPRAADRMPLLELELELKSGAARALPAFALSLQRALGKRHGLVPHGDSKAMRGYRLVNGAQVQPAKANAASFDAAVRGHATLESMLSALAGRATELVLANLWGATAADDPEFVHQARVALRRLRSAMRLLENTVKVPAALDSDLRWLAQLLGASRDATVMLTKTLPLLQSQLPAQAGAGARSFERARLRLHDRIGAGRERANRELRAALGSRRLALLALRLLQWSEAAPAAHGTPVGGVAPAVLAHARERLFKTARDFAELPARRQHRVRIRAKHLRYALDLLKPERPARTWQRYVDALADLQDTLGDLNDLAVLRAFLEDTRGAGPMLKATAAVHAAQRRALVARAAQQLAALAQQRAPWNT